MTDIIDSDDIIIGKGRTATVYDRGDKVLKVFEPWMPEFLARREYAASKAAFDHGVSTPQPNSLTIHAGQMAISFDKVEGKTLVEILLSDLERIADYGVQTARLHAELAMDEVWAEDLDQGKDYFLGRLASIEALTANQKKEIKTYLGCLEEGQALCHGDLHPDNILYSDGRLLIIDWMNGYIGHPASDAARTLMMMIGPLDPEMFPEHMIGQVLQVRETYRDAYVEAYTKLTGISQATIESWLLPNMAIRLGEGIEYEHEWLKTEIERRLDT